MPLIRENLSRINRDSRRRQLLAQSITHSDATTASQTFAAEMVSKLEEALRTGANVMSVSIDGVYTQFSRDQALKEYSFWKRRLAREGGTNPNVASINLANSGG